MQSQRLSRPLTDGDQARLQFTRRMRHDLLSPLNTLSGFLELLSEERAGPLNATQRLWIAKMRTATSSLLSLIEAAAKKEAGP